MLPTSEKMILEQINSGRLALFNKAPRLAFDHYIRWGRIPNELAKTMEETSSMKALIDTLKNYKSGGSDDGSDGWTNDGDDDEDDIPEEGLGHVYGFDAALLAIFTGGALLLAGEVAVEGSAAALEASAATARLESLLAPGGKVIGEAGTSDAVRELPGGAQAAEKMFGDLTKGGTISTAPNLAEINGVRYTMPDGSYITYRPVSTSGPPTIDVNVPSLINSVRKIKFLGGD